MGGLLAVAQGSHEEPRFIVLRYDGGGGGPLLGIVGKAVTFDTGGISIKPAAKMQEMKFDMSGGAAVLGRPRRSRGSSCRCACWPSCPRPRTCPPATRSSPGDIITISNGKTVEVNNTDAEGRLILADALAYAAAEGAERIVDLATLTGAIVVALGRPTRACSPTTTRSAARDRAAGERDRRALAAAAAPRLQGADARQGRRPRRTRRRRARHRPPTRPRSSRSSSTASPGRTSTSRARPGTRTTATTSARARPAGACGCWSSWRADLGAGR